MFWHSVAVFPFVFSISRDVQETNRLSAALRNLQTELFLKKQQKVVAKEKKVKKKKKSLMLQDVKN